MDSCRFVWEKDSPNCSGLSLCSSSFPMFPYSLLKVQFCIILGGISIFIHTHFKKATLLYTHHIYIEMCTHTQLTIYVYIHTHTQIYIYIYICTYQLHVFGSESPGLALARALRRRLGPKIRWISCSWPSASAKLQWIQGSQGDVQVLQRDWFGFVCILMILDLKAAYECIYNKSN